MVLVHFCASRSSAGAAVRAENRSRVSSNTDSRFYGGPGTPALPNPIAEHKKSPARFPGRGVLAGPAYSPLVLRARDQISV